MPPLYDLRRRCGRALCATGGVGGTVCGAPHEPGAGMRGGVVEMWSAGSARRARLRPGAEPVTEASAAARACLTMMWFAD